MNGYTIRFTFPDTDTPMFAGDHKGALGWAPTIDTALIWDSPDTAAQFLRDGYGVSKRWGEVVAIVDGEVWEIATLENGWVNA